MLYVNFFVLYQLKKKIKMKDSDLKTCRNCAYFKGVSVTTRSIFRNFQSLKIPKKNKCRMLK